MIRYLLVHGARAIVVVGGLLIATFLLTRTFADPARLMLPLDAPYEDYLRLRHNLGLDKPIWEQLLIYISDIATGNFGDSIWQRAPALKLVLDRLPATLLLASASITLAALLGLPLGIASGMKPESWIDRVALGVAALAVSIPDFWLGIMLALVLAVNLGWLPTSGYGGIEYLILPAATLAFRPFGRVTRVAREAVIEEISKPYVTTARAKGLTWRQVMWRHVTRNIMNVVITILGYEFVFVFTGYAVGVETVFAWPGVGKLAVDAVLHQDIILISAIVFVTGVVASVVNTALDMLCVAIDPRISA